MGSAPDYTLTVWDWAAGAALLRCKAFSQEVYGLGFCPHSPGCLVTCGTGHIRFWRMAATFTGLKLQVWGGTQDTASAGHLQNHLVCKGAPYNDNMTWKSHRGCFYAGRGNSGLGCSSSGIGVRSVGCVAAAHLSASACDTFWQRSGEQ